MKQENHFGAVQESARAWRASNPDTKAEFVLVLNRSAFKALDSVCGAVREEVGTQVVGVHGHIWTVQRLEDTDCPVCGCQMPDKAAFDEWGYFNCIERECGARLREQWNREVS
ncbi:hypothetical protein [Pseudomonas savastanoi]|uniref:hypothetical protein n=1 Tax=Pseudomonas savastanoi TaxID=29438 RepID=UPI000E32C53E|nr:hypothetical protein [Pseudomonas savastanoi]RMN01622.1 hypothetical protein ALQ68_200083 [Pseudomonas savastanoi pv. glycinea]